MDGFRVVKIDMVVKQIDILITCTGIYGGRKKSNPQFATFFFIFWEISSHTFLESFLLVSGPSLKWLSVLFIYFILFIFFHFLIYFLVSIELAPHASKEIRYNFRLKCKATTANL